MSAFRMSQRNFDALQSQNANSRPQTRDTRRTGESSYLTDDSFDDDHNLHFNLSSVLRLAKRNSHVVELLVYLVFLALFTAVALIAHPGEDMLLHNKALRNALTDQEIFFEKAQIRKVYQDIDSVDEFWDWLLGPFVNTVLPVGFPHKQGFFYPNFRILGLVRLRQLRVQRNSCVVPPELAAEVKSCIAEYAPPVEETAPYGPLDPATGAPAWSWSSAEDLGEGAYVGRSGVRFAGSGYNLTIPLDLAEATEQLQTLRNHRWIDVQTRVVFIDMLVYNANLNILSLVKLATEFPASAGLKPYLLLRSTPIFFLLPSEGGSAMFLAECMILGLTIVFMGVELWRIKHLGWLYIANVWPYVDWLNYIAFIAAFSLRLLPLRRVAASGFPPEPDRFVNYEPAMWMVVQWHNVIALNAVLTWLRLFKYAKDVPFMALLVKTLSKAAGQTLAFCSMLFVVYLGFSLAHHVAFGADLHAFRTLLNTMFALYRVLLSADFFDQMYDSNRVLGPLFFFAWTLIGYFVLLHMFIAILNEAIIFAHLELPRTTVAQTVKSAIVASRSAVTDVMHHSHARWALHKLNYRIQELPSEVLRTPAQHLLGEALEIERLKLEREAAEALHHHHHHELHPAAKEGQDGPADAAAEARKQGAAGQRAEVTRRLEAVEVALFQALQRLQRVDLSSADPAHDHEGAERSRGGSRANTPGQGILRGTGRTDKSFVADPRSSFKLRHPRPPASGVGVGSPKLMVEVASPRGALVTGTRPR